MRKDNEKKRNPHIKKREKIKNKINKKKTARKFGYIKRSTYFCKQNIIDNEKRQSYNSQNSHQE